MATNSQALHPPSRKTSLANLKADGSATPRMSFDAGINASSAWTGARESSQVGISEEKVSIEASIMEETESAQESDPPRSARALYDFEGKADLRELTLRAGQELTILKEDLAEGWSLAQLQGTLGLIPRKYYIFTTDFAPPPKVASTTATTDISLDPDDPSINMDMNGISHAISDFITTPLQPQTTGPYFASLRQTLLGGKSFNRFSNFVTSGAEDWVLNGLPDDQDDDRDSGADNESGSGSGSSIDTRVAATGSVKRMPDKFKKDDTRSETSSLHTDEEEESHANGGMDDGKHFVEMPPAWRSKAPPFKVIVHSPSKRASTLTGGYTVYSVTSVFRADDHTNPSMHSRFSSSSTIAARASTPTGKDNASHHQASSSYSQSPTAHSHLVEHGEDDEPKTVHVTVFRRFSNFVFLHTALSRHLPGIALPPLPDKQYTGRFNEDFVEARRGDLERWLARVVRHPLVRYSEVLVFFLSCDNETEWRRSVPMYLAPPPAPGPSFYGHVYHPDFNLDAEEAEEAIDRFQRHLRGVGQGVQGLRGVFGKVRDANVEMSAAQRTLSYALLSLITCTPTNNLPASPTVPSLAYAMSQWEDDEDEDGEGGDHSRTGLMNDEGAWCWRDGCEDCLRRTKAFQRLAETLQSVATAYDDHARRTQLATHETLKDVAHPGGIYAGVVDTHKSTLSRYTEAAGEYDQMDYQPDPDKAARCETVLNTTMAELDTYHTQKGEDFDKIAMEHLDGEIAFHEQVLARLRAARAAFDPNQNPTTSPTIPPTPTSKYWPASPTSSISQPHRQSSLSFQPLPPGPRQPSMYERDLAAATTRMVPPLPQPTAHVLDSTTPMRPVGVAVRDGMSILLGGVGLRSSVNGGIGHHGAALEGQNGTQGGGGVATSGMGVGIAIPGLEALRGSVMDFGRGRLWSSGSAG
ncbi:hypothetical protein FRB97_001202 [Tulasnella sp. 331]|nr:hypothetical protein FRB97_001202 [Tulasnella sp. 331]